MRKIERGQEAPLSFLGDVLFFTPKNRKKYVPPPFFSDKKARNRLALGVLSEYNAIYPELQRYNENNPLESDSLHINRRVT